MKINIIAAIGTNNEIGLNNQLLWHSKSELEHFKQLTLGKPIIMGRKTFESLPGILPGREHIVVSSDMSLWHTNDNVHYVYSESKESFIAAVEELKAMTQYDECFIIGGASIFEQALPLADELHISHMNWTGKADTFFPTIGSEWRSIGQYDRHPTMCDGSTWTYKRYIRKDIK